MVLAFRELFFFVMTFSLVDAKTMNCLRNSLNASHSFVVVIEMLDHCYLYQYFIIDFWTSKWNENFAKFTQKLSWKVQNFKQ